MPPTFDEQRMQRLALRAFADAVQEVREDGFSRIQFIMIVRGDREDGMAMVSHRGFFDDSSILEAMQICGERIFAGESVLAPELDQEEQ